MCDHKWGDGDREYSKERTICEGVDGHGEGHFILKVCDMCKAITIVKNDEPILTLRSNGRVEVYPYKEK